MESPEQEKRDITRYVNLEAPDEKIIHLEKVASEKVFNRKHDVWTCTRMWTERGAGG